MTDSTAGDVGDEANKAVNLIDVTKRYSDSSGKRTILDSLGMQLAGGEFVSITGPSGSGKSTLLNILGGVELPDSGSVLIGGEDIAIKTETERTLFRRHHIGFVFQFFNLVPTLTVEENLRLPLELCRLDYQPNLVEEWLLRFKLADRARSYPDVLSGGEQQRVAIIRAAIHRPSLILADEPTGNLDKAAGIEALEVLVSIAKEGTCIVMATHSEVAAHHADSRMNLQDGKLEITR